jgi:hypothetical protein
VFCRNKALRGISDNVRRSRPNWLIAELRSLPQKHFLVSAERTPRNILLKALHELLAAILALWPLCAAICVVAAAVTLYFRSRKQILFES